MRLMLQAFRRGLLKSEHTFGITSMIRENIVLDTLSMEDNSDYMWRHMMATQTAIAPHYDPKKIKSVLQDLKDDLAYIAAGYRFKKWDQVSPEERLLQGTAPLIEMFRQMQKSGIIDAFRKEVEQEQRKKKLCQG